MKMYEMSTEELQFTINNAMATMLEALAVEGYMNAEKSAEVMDNYGLVICDHKTFSMRVAALLGIKADSKPEFRLVKIVKRPSEVKPKDAQP